MKFRNVVVMFVLVALSALLVWALRGGDSDASLVPATAPGSFDRADVQRIENRAGDDEIILRRAVGASDSWELKVRDSFVRADAVLVDELLATMQKAIVGTHFVASDLTPGALRSYGLESPEMVIDLHLTGGKRTTRIGAVTRERTQMYVDRGPGTDVYVVPTDSRDEWMNAFSNGLRDHRVVDVQNYDIQYVEITRHGVTRLEIEKDLSQVWHVRQPFKGFANPQQFEEVLNAIANARASGVVDDDAQTVGEYGFVPPAYEILLRTKRGEERTVLVGGDAPGGEHVYVMEKGYPSVMVVGDRLAKAAAMDPQSFRDRAFTRLGYKTVVGLTVKLGDGVKTYRLDKPAASWEITSPPPRKPGNDTRCREALKSLVEWRTAAFHDDVQPNEVGISDDGKQIVVEIQGGEQLTFLIGDRLENGNVFAQSKGSGGVVEVRGEPVDLLEEGWLQFRTSRTRDFSTDEIVAIAQEPGGSEEGAQVERTGWERDLAAENKGWRNVGPGSTRKLDPAAINQLLDTIRAIDCTRWLFFDSSRREEMGFSEDYGKGTTVTVILEIGEQFGTPPHGHHQRLLVGNRVEGGGYFARWKGKGDWPWAFVLSEQIVEKLKRPLLRPR